eukprot:gnl/MRDRNA2_/MRDRNA2_117487_c0_seq1.p1 gnl/MRDRNA2_/MRDRNA2_117487_c0~~gnl/MRDRNA2_/MRDRNA2_117487_c0_seq1.p1  ORF type:complete len:107 (-),score=0.75 gnl/MRDRNA2_/MRDRNA2_117487_c0_seq1:198-518(-)
MAHPDYIYNGGENVGELMQYAVFASIRTVSTGMYAATFRTAALCTTYMPHKCPTTVQRECRRKNATCCLSSSSMLNRLSRHMHVLNLGGSLLVLLRLIMQSELSHC